MYYFKTTFKNSLVYRWSVFFSVGRLVLLIAINIMLWRVLYQNNITMISYMTRYTIISNIIMMFYSRGVHMRLAEKVTSGDFAIDLIRPVNLFFMFWQIEVSGIISNLLLCGLPVIVIYFPFIIGDTEYYNVLLVIIAVVLGHILFFMIYYLLGLTAFIIIEIEPIGRLLDDTIRLMAGGFIPLALLPSYLGKIANVLPFRYLYSFPLELLLGVKSVGNIMNKFIILCLWIFIFAFINICVYKIAIKKIAIQGG
ncbi:MAG: ABC transporter permease [Ruminiclostridium sp.]|nr:ABC transporter permease [Ruminiclostridium sp.]